MASVRKTTTKKLTQKAQRSAKALEPVNHVGLTFGPKHHVFVGKVKGGEIWALNQLSALAKTAITPLLEMWPPNPATITKPAKSVVQHTTDLMTTLRAEWGTLPFFLDTRYMPAGGIPSATQATSVFAIARALQLTAVPVTSLSSAPAYQQAIGTAAATDGRGVMIRLTTQEFTNSALLAAYLTALLGVLRLSPQQVDVALDLEYRANQLEVQQLGSSLMATLPFLNDWRTVTLISGCFPQTSPAQIGMWNPVARADWLGWLQVANTQITAGKPCRAPLTTATSILAASQPNSSKIRSCSAWENFVLNAASRTTRISESRVLKTGILQDPLRFGFLLDILVAFNDHLPCSDRYRFPASGQL